MGKIDENKKFNDNLWLKPVMKLQFDAKDFLAEKIEIK